QIEDRDPQPFGGFLDADDLLDRPRSPRARLDRRVVGHHAHGAALDAPDHCHDAVGAVARLLAVGQQPILDQEIGVEQQLEAAPHGQLVLLAKLFRVLRGPAGTAGVGPDVELVLRAHADTVPARGSLSACTLPGSGLPRVRSSPRATSIRRVKSTPVAIPMPSSSASASSLQRLPAAPGANGLPPIPPTDPSNRLTPV